MINHEADSLLSCYRALDLADEKGCLCGKLLADMGADVTKVERPGGDPCRNIGPFYHDIPHPERSLFWFAYNSNKRGITLNIETTDGQKILKKLVKTADFVIESFPPGYMDKLGLGYSALREINPRLIMTSITPFGQTGPYRDYKASDLEVMAMGGLLYGIGDPDRPPVRITIPQSHCHAGTEAAMGTLVACYHREITGEGQHVDVSMQGSLHRCSLALLVWWDLQRIVMPRLGSYRPGSTVDGRGNKAIYPCKDGYVNFIIYGGQVGASTNRRMAEWIASKGLGSEVFEGVNWDALDMWTLDEEKLDSFEQVIGKFIQTLTKEEFYEECVSRGIMGYPVYTIKDIVEDTQLAERNVWVLVNHPELGDAIVYPGPFAKLSETPMRVNRRAPLIGEHNIEVYEQELGFSRDEIMTLKQGGII